jgi:hypothetical protein
MIDQRLRSKDQGPNLGLGSQAVGVYRAVRQAEPARQCVTRQSLVARRARNLTLTAAKLLYSSIWAVYN